MGGVPAEDQPDVTQARLECLLEPRQIGGLPACQAGPFELSDQAGFLGLLGAEATDHLVLGGCPIGEDVQKPDDAPFDVAEVSFYLRLSTVGLLALGFETVQGLVEGTGQELFVQHFTARIVPKETADKEGLTKNSRGPVP